LSTGAKEVRKSTDKYLDKSMQRPSSPPDRPVALTLDQGHT